MSDMFKLYDNTPEGYVPNNRPWAHIPPKLVIMDGETTEHSFEVPFNVDTDTKDYKVIYKYNLDEVIVKNKEDIEVTTIDRPFFNCILTCTLSADETKVFNNLLLDCYAQLKFVNLDDTISYSKVYPVKLMHSLDNGEVK